MTAPGLPAGHAVRVLDEGPAWVDGVVEAVQAALAGAPAPRVVLAGGGTPVPVYEALARTAAGPGLPWSRTRFTWSDERMVPPEDPESNYGMARRTLLDPLDVPGDHVLRIRGEDPPERAAEKIHRGLVVWSQRVPLFDLVLLGLGEDGHVASLFPGEDRPDFGARLAAVTRHPEGRPRVTLTPAALASTRLTLFLVAGEAKAKAVARTLQAEAASPRVPARTVTGAGRAVWLLDPAAASDLPEAWRAESAG